MAGMLAPLYEADWQKMRVSFLGAHQSMGGFTTPQGTKDNLERLNQYITMDAPPSNPAIPNNAVEKACRVWRGLNLLNATTMGLSGQGKADSEQSQAIRTYKDKLSELHDGHSLVKVDNAWNWDAEYAKLEEMYRSDDYWFRAIFKDLSRRKRSTDNKGVGLEHRGELVKYLTMMETIRGV